MTFGLPHLADSISLHAELPHACHESPPHWHVFFFVSSNKTVMYTGQNTAQTTNLVTNLVATNTYLTYVATLNPDTNELIYKTVELVNLRVSRAGDVIALMSYPTNKIVPANIQFKVQASCTVYDILLRNGLSVQVVDGYVYAFSYFNDTFDFFKIQEIQKSPTNYALLIDASASTSTLYDDTTQIVKKSPCRRCQRTYVVFRSMLNEGLWPVFIGNNQIVSDINGYNIVQLQGKQYVVSDVVKVSSKSQVNVLTMQITRLDKRPIRLNYVAYI